MAFPNRKKYFSYHFLTISRRRRLLYSKNGSALTGRNDKKMNKKNDKKMR